MTENTASTATVDQEDDAAATAVTPSEETAGPVDLPPGLDVDEPETLASAERTYEHEDADYCAAGTDGRVIVGVTNADDGVLLLTNPEREHAILPNCHVEDGDWAAVARRTVEESSGVPIDLEGPEAVRAVEHRIEGEDGVDSRTYHVVFRASPTADGQGTTPACDDPDWEVDWYDEIPYEIDSEHDDVIADLERFLP